MKTRITYWHVLIVAGLGLFGTANALEPVAGAKSSGQSAAKSKPAEEDAHGLFAARLAAAASPEKPADKAPVQTAKEPVDELQLDEELSWIKPSPVRTALFTGAEDWRTEYFHRVSAPSEPTLSESCGCTATSTCCDCACDPLWCHRCGVFADLLYLRAGNIDYVYAVEQTGTLATDSPTGPTGRVGFDGALGYRVGGTIALSDCSSIQVSYTWFQDNTSNSITANNPNVLIFQPGVPQIPNVGSSAITASAREDIRFQLADIDYRGLLYGTQNSYLNYFGGVRYANLKQDFHAQEDTGVPVGLRDASTHISFDGFGIGMGLDGMRRAANCGVLVYGRASASFVAGEFKAQYREVAQFGPNSVIGNNLIDFRVMTILQTELGTGWQSCDGRIRATIGYTFAGWMNALTAPSYILGVQNREFHNLNETITFDGLVTRLTFQF